MKKIFINKIDLRVSSLIWQYNKNSTTLQVYRRISAERGTKKILLKKGS